MTVEWIKYAQSLTDEADEGHADRAGHDPELVLRARRPAALGVVLAARAGDPRRSARPGKGGRTRHPDRRSGAARRPAAAPVAMEASTCDWAVESFRITANGVQDETQIHTHMCYSEFNDIIASIADMDADVITIETSRSDMELLDAFDDFKYPNEIGPGVYDIHSPNIPTRGAHRRPDEEGGRAHSGRAPVGQSRLRPEDARMGGSDSGADEHGRRCAHIASGRLKARRRFCSTRGRVDRFTIRSAQPTAALGRPFSHPLSP